MRCKDTTLFSKNKEFYRKNIATIAELRYFILDLTACLSPCEDGDRHAVRLRLFDDIEAYTG